MEMFFKLSDNGNINVEDPGGSDAMLVIETDDTSGYVGGAAVDVNVTPGEPMQVNVPVALINGGNFIMTASETDTATVELASTELSQAGEVFTLSFTPTQSTIQFKVINTQPGAGMIGLGEVDFAVLMPTAVNVLVRVCDESEDWRFGYQTQEKVNEIAGVGNHYEYKFRGYDSRLGRFKSTDPLHDSYPWNSDYAFAENKPIKNIDLEGLEAASSSILIFRNSEGKTIVQQADDNRLAGQLGYGSTGHYYEVVDEVNNIRGGYYVPDVSVTAKRIFFKPKYSSRFAEWENETFAPACYSLVYHIPITKMATSTMSAITGRDLSMPTLADAQNGAQVSGAPLSAGRRVAKGIVGLSEFVGMSLGGRRGFAEDVGLGLGIDLVDKHLYNLSDNQRTGVGFGKAVYDYRKEVIKKPIKAIAEAANYGVGTAAETVDQKLGADEK